MNLGSLSFRLRFIATACLLIVTVLPIAGSALIYSFKQSTTASFDARLESLLNVVVAAVQVDALGDVELSRSLGDPRFEQIYSGWYWQLASTSETLFVSRSLWDQRLTPTADQQNNNLIVRAGVGPRGQRLRVVERDIQLANQPGPIHLMVAGPAAEIDLEVARFQQLIIGSLVTLAGILILFMVLQVRWGLSPLRSMQVSLRELQAGNTGRLDTELPKELQGLATALNGVLDRDQRLLEHSRTAAGNLAHALKTPLAVLKTQLPQLAENERTAIATEIERIDRAVQHHLARAAAGGVYQADRFAEVGGTLQPIIQAMRHFAKGQNVILQLAELPAIKVAVAAQDLQEMIGNLLENAVRYAQTRVMMTCRLLDEQLILEIIDDGPGLPEAEQAQALARGTRFDQQNLGSGLGLAIVADLTALYQGQLNLSTNTQGGLTVTLTLPRRAFKPSTAHPD